MLNRLAVVVDDVQLRPRTLGPKTFAREKTRDLRHLIGRILDSLRMEPGYYYVGLRR